MDGRIRSGHDGKRKAANELAYQLRSSEDPEAGPAARGAGQFVGQVPAMRPHDLPPRPGQDLVGLSALRSSHAAGGQGPPELPFDGGQYQRIELPKGQVDPLKFRDGKRYADRLKESQAKTNDHDAIVVAHGKIGGVGVVVAAFNFAFMGGSMGIAVGDGLVAAAELAVLQDAALIVVPASGGARMQEGILSLMQMARTTVAVNKVKEKGLPYIVLLTDPTTGGVSASFAMLGDIHIAEPGAVIGFAGARVIETTIREVLPEGFQRAEYLLEHGMVDMVVHRHKLTETLSRLLGLLRHPGPSGQLLSLPYDRPDGFETETSV